MQTVIRKDVYAGKIAKSEKVIDQLSDDKRSAILQISTSKGRRGIQSFVNISFEDKHQTSPSGFVSRSHMMFQDYAKHIPNTLNKTRATEKSLLEVHNHTLEHIDAIVEDAISHYNK
jgi:hypothetical protein